MFTHGKHKKQNDTFLFLISDLDFLVLHRPNNDMNYLIVETVVTIQVNQFLRSLKVTFCP